MLSDGRTFEAEIVGRDPRSDLAVIRVLDGNDDMGTLPMARMGDSDGLRAGDWVIAVGSPFRLSQTVTAGIVSATGRANLNLAEYEDFIQTDAAINPGNSGGAMVTLDGKVVGINTAIATRTGAYQGIGFAIPVSMASQVMESILTHGRVVRGFLGVMIQDINNDLARALDLDRRQGSLVSDVTAGSAADRAGVEEGDVILEVNGQPVENSNDLRFKISGTTPGTTVELTVLREGRTRTIDVVLDERPDEDNPPIASSGDGLEDEVGLNLTRLTPSLRERLELEDGTYGAVVEGIRPGSPASKAGLRQGDVIQEVHRSDVEAPGDFWTVVADADPGETVLLRVLRAGQRLFIGLTMPD
jgi:serine protease Do